MRTYKKAVTKGVIKVMSKMGISTVQSYQGAQIFEAVGLSSEFVEKYFTGTPSRIGGIGIEEFAAEVEERHAAAFDERAPDYGTLPVGGDWQWRKNGEYHLYNPESVHLLQKSCREGDYAAFKRYTALIDDQTARQCTFRGLMKFKPAERRSPSRRSRRSTRSSSASRRAPCPSAPSARKPTRRWRSR